MAKDKAGVLRALKRHGLAKYADLVRDALEPAVRLIARDAGARKVALGKSKLGGEPHLPDLAQWPRHRSGRPMHFLAQVRLSDLPTGHLPRDLLPRRGWLYFWWDSLCWWQDSNTRFGNDWLSDGFIVTYESAESLALRRRPFPAFAVPKLSKQDRLIFYQPPRFGPDPELGVRLVPVMSIRNENVHALSEAADKDLGRNAFRKILEFYADVLAETMIPGGGSGNHRLLGDAFEMQSDMREDCHRDSRATGYPVLRGEPNPPELMPYRRSTDAEKRPWRLLAMFDSDDRLGWMWSDVGELYFWIREQDLAARDFSLVHGTIVSG